MKNTEDKIIRRVKDFILEHHLIESGDRVLLSLSAGKDSMILLDIIGKIEKELGFSSAIFHLNHLARGISSDEDENFLQTLAVNRGMEFYCEKHDFTVDDDKGSFEERARKVRYELLHETAEKSRFNRIATAHNNNDNVETILMRILLGTGIHGLRGIPIRRGKIIRPLLCLSQNEIYAYLDSVGITWREDESNRENLYLRNYIRNELMPLIAKRFPRAETSIDHLGFVAEEQVNLAMNLLKSKYGVIFYETEKGIILNGELCNDEKAFKFLLGMVLSEYFNGYFVSRGILKEIIRRLKTTKAHVELYNSGNLVIRKTISENQPVVIVSYKDTEYRESENRWEIRIDLTGQVPGDFHPEGSRYRFHIMMCNHSFFTAHRYARNFLFIALSDNIEYIVLRNRRRGDRISLENGAKSLKNLMIDNKLDSKSKWSIPLLIVDAQIAAVMMGTVHGKTHRVSADFQVREDSQRILAVCIKNI